MLTAPSHAHASGKHKGSLTLDAINTTSSGDGGYLSVPAPAAQVGAGGSVSLTHQRSLDSIAEVQEPSSGVSSHFPKRDSVVSYLDSATPKRLTWG